MCYLSVLLKAKMPIAICKWGLWPRLVRTLWVSSCWLFELTRSLWKIKIIYPMSFIHVGVWEWSLFWYYVKNFHNYALKWWWTCILLFFWFINYVVDCFTFNEKSHLKSNRLIDWNAWNTVCITLTYMPILFTSWPSCCPAKHCLAYDIANLVTWETPWTGWLQY